MPSRAQETLPDDGTRGGSLEHETSRVWLGKHTVFVDAPSFPKQFRTKVKGGRRSVPPPLSLAQDPDVAVTRVLDLLTHPGPLGEGWTACDVKER